PAWRQVATTSQEETPKLATAGDFLATTSPGAIWRPQERHQAPSGDKHAEQGICDGLGLKTHTNLLKHVINA
ncbi:hypothetical protein A2U01_0066932, partial [Trifolium medium]|nr:hypothetical protein [Trifolium medium]